MKKNHVKPSSIEQAATSIYTISSSCVILICWSVNSRWLTQYIQVISLFVYTEISLIVAKNVTNQKQVIDSMAPYVSNNRHLSSPEYSDPRNLWTLSRSQLQLFASYVATVNRFRGLILELCTCWLVGPVQLDFKRTWCYSLREALFRYPVTR